MTKKDRELLIDLIREIDIILSGITTSSYQWVADHIDLKVAISILNQIYKRRRQG